MGIRYASTAPIANGLKVLAQGAGVAAGAYYKNKKKEDTANEIDKLGEKLHGILDSNKDQAIASDINAEADQYKNTPSNAVEVDNYGNPIMNSDNTFKRVVADKDIVGTAAPKDKSKPLSPDNPIVYSKNTFKTLQKQPNGDNNKPFKGDYSGSAIQGDTLTESNKSDAYPKEIKKVDLDKYKINKYKDFYNNASQKYKYLLPQPKDIVDKDGKFNPEPIHQSLGKLFVLWQATTSPYAKNVRATNGFKNIFNTSGTGDLDTMLKKQRYKINNLDIDRKKKGIGLDNTVVSMRIEQQIKDSMNGTRIGKLILKYGTSAVLSAVDSSIRKGETATDKLYSKSEIFGGLAALNSSGDQGKGIHNKKLYKYLLSKYSKQYKALGYKFVKINLKDANGKSVKDVYGEPIVVHKLVIAR